MAAAQGRLAFGVWSYTGWRRKFRAIVLICQVLIQPGVYNGGKRSGLTLVGLHGRKRQAWEGGGGGAAPQGQRQQQRWLQGKVWGEGEVDMERRRRGGLLSGPRHSN